MPEPPNLPRWQSHKQVWADKIVAVAYPDTRVPPAESSLMLTLACGDKVIPQRRLETNGQQLSGGYYLVYDDGYESWSPAAAFENGYTRLPEGKKYFWGLIQEDSPQPETGTP
jgi:hypothetical protein